MKAIVILGIVLILLGVVGIVWGGITYTKDRDSADLGPVHVNVSRKETLPIHPAIGAVVLVGGIALVAVGMRRGKPA